VAEVHIGGSRGGTPGGKGGGDGEGCERQSAFAPSSGSQLVDRGVFGSGRCGGLVFDGRLCGGLFDGGSTDRGERGGRCHQGFHRGGRPGVVRRQGTQFQQDRAKVTGVFHAGVGQQFVDDLLVPG
jgi:hypothetical protein